MVLLKSIEKQNKQGGYPFSVPAIQELHTLQFNSPITIFVGDNGTGKSTLLELIACKLNLYRISNDLNYRDPDFIPIKEAASSFKLNYSVKPKGFFFRSEDFTTYVSFLHQAKKEAREEIKRIDETFTKSSDYAKTLAKSAHYRTLGEVRSMYQRSLEEESHGQAYLDFFKSRLRPNSLYILDEAEVPLSFANQLGLLMLIKEAVNDGCQFIISTHSPVIMSYRAAEIHELTENGIRSSTFESLEAVNLMKDFLNHRDRYLNHIFS